MQLQLLCFSCNKVSSGTTVEHGASSRDETTTSNNASNDASLLKDFLCTDWEKYTPKEYKCYPRNKALGRTLMLPMSVRGCSRNFKDAVHKVREYFGKTMAEQKAIRATYLDLTTPVKKMYKANSRFLNTRLAKVAAANAIDGGAEIAQSIGYDLEGVEDSNTHERNSHASGRRGHNSEEVEADEEVYQHIGLADSEEGRRAFQENRTDKRSMNKNKRPKLGEAPTDVCHLGREICSKAERNAMVHIATYLDSTFIEDSLPLAPKRTGIFIMIDEVKHTTKAGGIIGKVIRSGKPKITIAANNVAEFKYVMDQARLALGRH